MADRHYTVLGQRPTTDVDILGNVVEVIEVTYQGPGGITDRVKIPEANYIPQNVDAVIRARLATRLEVARLGEVQ